MRKVLSVLVAGALLFALPAVAEAGKKKKKKASGPVVLWEDAAGDADIGTGGGQSPPLGVDLAGAEMVKNGDNLEFTVTHHDMPPVGSMPEAARFLWAFSVDDNLYRFTVKSFDIGKPDVVGGQTTDRVGRVDATGHFRLEGECARDATLPVGMVNCPPVEYLEGSFDPAKMAFTIIVPLELIEAKPGSVIAPAGGDQASICQICWITQVAERSLNTTVIDMAGMPESYKIPK